jgi:F-type H+-transporting ATPase subunit delta
MAEFATIARPYAEALFKTSSGRAHPDLVLEWLGEMSMFASDEQLLSLAANPRVTATELQDLIKGLFKKELDSEAQNFLHLIIEQSRLEVLPEIYRQFKVLHNSLKGSQDAVVESAFAIDPHTLSEISSLLEKRFARKLNLTVELNPELIGGIRVVVGDEVLDTSVKARLEQMKVELME